jgi:hypothetical protein
MTDLDVTLVPRELKNSVFHEGPLIFRFWRREKKIAIPPSFTM